MSTDVGVQVSSLAPGKKHCESSAFFNDINPLTWICDMLFGRDIRLRRAICLRAWVDYYHITFAARQTYRIRRKPNISQFDLSKLYRISCKRDISLDLTAAVRLLFSFSPLPKKTCRRAFTFFDLYSMCFRCRMILKNKLFFQFLYLG